MIHLIIGNTGAGKTTYASILKHKTKGVIFSIDQWNKNLFLDDKKPEDGLEWFLERIQRAEIMIMKLVEQLEESGVDSILDLGFSKVYHREKFRKFAEKNNYEVKIHFLDIPKETRLDRIMSRNSQKGSTFEFEVSKSDFDFMETWFERPNENEMINAIHIVN